MGRPSRGAWEPISFDGLKTTSLKDRPSKVGIRDFARSWEPGGLFSDFLERLPGILAVEEFRRAAGAIAEAVRGERTILLGMGAHPIKVGLNPVIIDAMERGILTGLVEVAIAGKTSEDVAAHLDRGCFGTARETAEFIHGAVRDACDRGGVGLGAAVGRRLVDDAVPHAESSLLASASRLGIPVTVHVALGTDIIHMHPAMDGAAMGALSHRDFRLFCFINLGSAVVLPEVFLKAVSVAHNLGYSLDGITTLNMDFQRHYRPTVNVVQRPTLGTGTGITLIGHHEIMFPLLMAAVVERLFREV